MGKRVVHVLSEQLQGFSSQYSVDTDKLFLNMPPADKQSGSQISNITDRAQVYALASLGFWCLPPRVW
jgi:hypothetical protein